MQCRSFEELDQALGQRQFVTRQYATFSGLSSFSKLQATLVCAPLGNESYPTSINDRSIINGPGRFF